MRLTKCIVLDCQPISYIDYMGVSTLLQVLKELNSIGVRLLLADVPCKMLEKIQMTMKSPCSART